MKILLIGEFSSFHKMLKEGLEKIGHTVVLASNGDGSRNIKRDINFAKVYKGKLGSLELIYRLFKIVPRLKNFDVVQLITPVSFPLNFGINNYLTKKILSNNKNVFLVGAGGSNHNTAIADFFETKYKYTNLYHEIKKNHNNKLWSQSNEGRIFNEFLLGKIKGYIPIMYEYAQPFRKGKGLNKLCKTIPIPLNIENIKYKENKINNKIIIFHGISRADKGTDIIEVAMKKIKEKYPDDVEIILKGNLPLNDYLEIISNANIVIDQTYTVSYGVNAIYNMAMGKVVLGGGKAECLKEFNLNSSPLVPIEPNEKDIYKKLEYLISKKETIRKIGYDSRKFVEEVHDYKKIAKKFVDVWTEKSNL